MHSSKHRRSYSSKISTATASSCTHFYLLINLYQTGRSTL
ncbi:hypothetical protein SLEP1_g41846 [Rubroshorea leprosula]|uniref:Uncharacterized protein n=1 Tax=Rubroshorea leprosula TaxID=152421 RepID=A0AAV5L7U3_9ROSI|nr:hypothetical protein SLEP1_g41846 [Rubroshorea leprosula]